jgi:hypothetical protein
LIHTHTSVHSGRLNRRLLLKETVVEILNFSPQELAATG